MLTSTSLQDVRGEAAMGSVLDLYLKTGLPGASEYLGCSLT